MKTIQLINQNIPVWSFLCGDHALKQEVLKINKDLLEKPDFLCPLENELRYSVLKSKRSWITDTFKEKASFAVVQFSYKELMSFNTCFSEITFKNYVEEFINAKEKERDFLYKRTYKQNISKPYSTVLYQENMSFDLEISYKDKGNKISLKNVLDSSIYNPDCLSVAMNRGLIIDEGGTKSIYDATHRLTAYAWSKHRNKKLLPDSFYCFYYKRVP